MTNKHADLHLDESKVFALVAALQNTSKLQSYLASARNEVMNLQQPFALQDLLGEEDLELRFNMIYDPDDITVSTRELGDIAIGLVVAVAQLENCDVLSAFSILAGSYSDSRDKTFLEDFGWYFAAVASIAFAVVTLGGSALVEAGMGSVVLTLQVAGAGASVLMLVNSYEQYRRDEMSTEQFVLSTAYTLFVVGGASSAAAKLFGEVLVGEYAASIAMGGSRGFAAATSGGYAASGANLPWVPPAIPTTTKAGLMLIEYSEYIELQSFYVFKGKTIQEMAVSSNQKIVSSDLMKRFKDGFGLTDEEVISLGNSIAIAQRIQRDSDKAQVGSISINSDHTQILLPNDQGISAADFEQERLATWLKVNLKDFRNGNFDSDVDLISALAEVRMSKTYDEMPPDMKRLLNRFATSGFPHGYAGFERFNKYFE